MTTNQPLGLLMMAYGTPQHPSEVLPYYTHIRHGHPPSEAQLADLIRRYEAIGGVSPLAQTTTEQATGIAAILNQDGGRPVKMYLGYKHTSPFIEDAVAAMHADGISEAVALVLAPHYSTMSVGAYQKNAAAKAEQLGGPNLWFVNDWHMHPRFLQLLANRVQDALSQCTQPEQAMVVFSAHSLPERILQMGDPYVDQLHESGEAIARMLKLPHYTFAWQSAGRTNEPWLGPDILDKLQSLKGEGYTNIVSCSQGFVSDHLEVLYDIDIEAQQLANELGIQLVRTKQMNDDPEFLTALAEVARGREAKGDN